MLVKIRSGTPDDADFLAWVMLSSSRAHLARGMWDVIIGSDEAGCLEYLRRLAITEPHSLYHCTRFLIAEVEGTPAAALCGFLARNAWTLAAEAMANVQRDLGWTDREAAASQQRIAPVWASCLPPDIGADFAIENVATLPQYRRRGIAAALLEQVLDNGREYGCRLAQISTYIGNGPAISAYEKCGFRMRGEKRCSELQNRLHVPGFVRLARDLGREN